MLLMMVAVLALTLGSGGGHMGMMDHQGPAHNIATSPAETGSGSIGEPHSVEMPE